MKQNARVLSLLFIAVVALAACRKKSSSTETEPEATPTPTPTPAPAVQTTDVFKIVSTGPSLSFNDQTGGVNSLAVNPVTGLPAVAYYDKNATVALTTTLGALKFASLGATGAWTVEVIDANYGTAACGTASSYCIGAPNAAGANTAKIIDVAYTSDGRPAIAYVYGASLNTAGGFKQLRLAELATDGKWYVSIPFQSSTAAVATNVAIAATVDPMKGVSLVFDAQNRPHITFAFYTQTATNSRVKYLFRGTDGVWISSDAATALSGSGTLTVVGQGMNQGGMAYCAGAGPVFSAFEVTGAAGIGRPLYVRCSALDTTGACTTWVSTALTNGCSGAACFSSGIASGSNAGQRTDLVLNPNNNQPILGVYSTATPATSLFTGTVPAACSAAPSATAASWGAMASVGTASQGLNGFAIAASTTELFAQYLVGTASVAVNKCDLSSCTWLATPTTIDTATVAGEGVGFAYDNLSGALYGSYARIPAAAVATAGNDLIVSSGFSADITLSGSLSFALAWVDNLANVFPSVAIPTLAAAKAPNGLYGYAYFYQDATAADMKLYYGFRGGPASAPAFSSSFVTSHAESAAAQFIGAHPALTYDASSNPLIAYYNGVNRSLELASSPNGGVSFSVTMIDDHGTNDLGQYPSIAIHSGVIGIAYYDATNTGLKFARSNSNGAWMRYSVDGIAGTGSCGNVGADAGKYASLEFTSTGRPVITYQSDNGLKIAYASEAATSATYAWTCVQLDASGNARGSGISMHLSATDTPYIAHFDATAGTIRYVGCASPIADCIANPTRFTAELVNATGTTSLVSTTPSLRVTDDGTIYIAHYSAAFQALALTRKTTTSTDWSVVEYIDGPTSGNSYTSLAGQHPVLLLNDAGYPLAFYRSRENWIRYFSREPR